MGHAATNVFAVGDVARWRVEPSGLNVRTEHQLNAIEQGRAVAVGITRGSYTVSPQPFFWSNLFDARIQVHGHPQGASTYSIIAGDWLTDRFVVAASSEDVPVALIGWNMPKEFGAARRVFVEGDMSGLIASGITPSGAQRGGCRR